MKGNPKNLPVDDLKRLAERAARNREWLTAAELYRQGAAQPGLSADDRFFLEFERLECAVKNRGFRKQIEIDTQRVIDLAEKTGDPQKLIKALLLASQFLHYAGSPQNWVQPIEKALELAR
jgi:hypothetical protein